MKHGDLFYCSGELRIYMSREFINIAKNTPTSGDHGCALDLCGQRTISYSSSNYTASHLRVNELGINLFDMLDKFKEELP